MLTLSIHKERLGKIGQKPRLTWEYILKISRKNLDHHKNLRRGPSGSLCFLDLDLLPPLWESQKTCEIQSTYIAFP